MNRCICVLLALFPLALSAQQFRATVSGSVADQTGAAIAGATVTALEVKTGVKSQATTDASGSYTIPFLLPGEYNVAAESQGFQKFSRSGLYLGSGDHPTVDFSLQIGSATSEVSVVADVPLVDTTSASTGQTITTKQVEDLPVSGRTPLMLAQLSMGVMPQGQPGQLVHPFDNAGATNITIAGSKIQSAEILLDGSPDTTWDQRVAYNPPMDAVQQVTVDIFDTSAQYGHSSSGTANQITKSGTNAFHGSVYEFNQNNFTSANNYFSNASGKPVPVLHYNQYGLTAGAPIIIPKIVNGKNKLFWFFAWEGLKDNQPVPTTTTVPTAAERTGDFSQLLSLGSAYQIYNPYTGATSGKNIVRKPFANNTIPASLLNPVALSLLKLYPLPNQTGLANGENNYFVNANSLDNFDSELGRLDYSINDSNKVFLDMRHNYRNQVKNNYLGNTATGTLLDRENFGVTADYVHTFGGSSVMDVRLNWTRMDENHSEPSAGFDPTTLGFPAYLAQSSSHVQLPAISFGSCGSFTSFQCLGDTGASMLPSESYQLYGSFVKVAGQHTITVGGDARRFNLGVTSYGAADGTFTFGTNWTVGPTSGSNAAPIGQELASFLMGLPTSGSYNEPASAYLRSYYYGLFIQDDWRIRPNLTVNLGLRFETDTDMTERYNRIVNGFDGAVANPVAGAAEAAYASLYVKNPGVYPIAPSAFSVNGGLTFATPANPAAYNVLTHPVSPRIGVSWSPSMFHDRTVFRAGFGMFAAPLNSTALTTIASNGNISSSPVLNQEGFSQSTPLTATSNNYLTPAVAGQATLSNPFPGAGILQPAGNSAGLATFNGQSVSFIDPNMRNPYSARWQFDIQQQLAKNLLLEIAYIGNRANHVPINITQLNAIPRQYLSTSNIKDPSDTATTTYLSQSVANPFSGLFPNGGSLNGKTVPLWQLLVPYPQFAGVSNFSSVGGTANGVAMQNATSGSSWYNSINARVEKRLSNGLSLIGTYTYSRFMEQDDYLNDTDPKPETRVSVFDHPNHFAAGFSYELPVGKGRAVDIRNRWLEALAGGWEVNGIYNWETGAPIYWSSNVVYCSVAGAGCNGFGGPINLKNNVAGQALNLQAFDLVPADQPQYNIRTFGTTFSNLRTDSPDNLDASLIKKFFITERTYLQLRFEAYNALNHPVFSAPTVSNATSTTFGLVQSTANAPRAIQLGARFVW